MKLRATSYTFDASAKTIVCSSFTSLEAIQLITNVTDNVIIYNFADATKGGTLSGTTLTLTYDTTSMDDTDKLQVLVEDGSTTIAASGTVAVTGVSTAANQTTIIGHVDGIEGLLTTIDSDTSALAGAIAGTEVQVDVVGSLPAGTNAIGKLAANSGVDIGDVDITSIIPGVGATNLGKAIDTATGATDTGVLVLATRDDALSTLTPAESDNVQLRTNSTGALWVIPSGTVTVDGSGVTQPVSGTVTANLSATDNAVLDDIAADTEAIKTSLAGTLTVTGGGGGTEYTEDAAAAANPVGTTLILIREDARAGNLTSTDGDNVAIRGNNKGEMYVKTTDSDALLTTIDGDTGNISTKIDTIAGAVSGTEMQVDVLTMPTVTVNAHAVTNAGTFVVQENGAALTALQLIDDTVATLGTTTYTETTTKGLVIGAVRRDADTTLVDTTNEVGPVQMNAAGQLKVEVFSGETLPVSLTSTTVTGTVAVTQSGTWDEVGINDSGNSITVDNAGTFAVQDATAQASLSVMDDWDNAASDGASVSGDVAHDSADAGEPVKIGFKAYSPDGTTPGTAVAEGDRTDGKADLDGRHLVNDEHPRWWSYHVDGSSALTDAAVQADPGDGFQIVITNIVCSSGAATAMNFFLEEGSTKIFGPIYLEAVAGRGFCTPAGFKKHVTASTAVTITTSAAIAHSVDIQGYIQAV